MMKTFDIPLHFPSSYLTEVIYWRSTLALISTDVEFSHAKALPDILHLSVILIDDDVLEE